MAKVISTERKRGKLGSYVYARNRGGDYVRALGPSNYSGSVPQQARTAAFTTLVNNWNSLSDATYLLWVDAAKSHRWRRLYGKSYKLSGRELFFKLNLPFVYEGLLAMLTPPRLISVPACRLMSCAFSLLDESFILNFSGNLNNTEIQSSYWATAPLSPSIRAFNPYLRRALFVPNSPTASVNIFNAYIALYGTPSVGQRIGVMYKCYSASSRQLIATTTASCIVTA